MKVTNLETSQKLKELGFESNEGIKQYVGVKEFFGKGVSGKDVYYTGYLLETILRALPDYISKGEGRNPKSFLLMDKKGIGYAQNPMIEYREFFTFNEGESLSNTAGRLLIKLLEDNIIKLGE